ncbi:MAG: glycosyltransferase family 2 protein [Actinobacteria bacterium]|nr:glycosyltransferase family 2 protein [Actinomycetota bacterium]
MISLIFPTYNEVENLPFLYRKIDKVIKKINDKFELIFIDDYSTDNTYAYLKTLANHDHRIKVIRFARNFGSHSAITAGLTCCKGSAAIVMASDLQDPPKIIPLLINKWKKGAKIVWGVREKREGEGKLNLLLSRFYYQLINFLTTLAVFSLGADVFLADRVVINEFKKIPEKHSSVFMILSWLGFPQGSVYYIKEKRYLGKPKWTLSQKVKLVLDSVLSFSDIPIRYASVVGIITALIGFIYAFVIFYSRIFNHHFIEGWALVLIAVFILGGVQMLILGILGEYIWRTFDESRHRPRYIIENMINITNN